jgi:hypothetical protein
MPRRMDDAELRAFVFTTSAHSVKARALQRDGVAALCVDGRRDAVDGELLVRLHADHVLSETEVAGC